MEKIIGPLLMLTGVFVSAVSQVMLKKSTLKSYDSRIREYINPLVIFAYFLYVLTTFLSIIAYRFIPLSMGPVLESTSYIYVTVFGGIIFGEKIGAKRILALILIILGIIVYATLG